MVLEVRSPAIAVFSRAAFLLETLGDIVSLRFPASGGAHAPCSWPLRPSSQQATGDPAHSLWFSLPLIAPHLRTLKCQLPS